MGQCFRSDPCAFLHGLQDISLLDIGTDESAVVAVPASGRVNDLFYRNGKGAVFLSFLEGYTSLFRQGDIKNTVIL